MSNHWRQLQQDNNRQRWAQEAEIKIKPEQCPFCKAPSSYLEWFGRYIFCKSCAREYLPDVQV